MALGFALCLAIFSTALFSSPPTLQQSSLLAQVVIVLFY